MSITNSNGKGISIIGNLLISYKFKSDNFDKQINEEKELKKELANLLNAKGYKFALADDDLINEKLKNN